MDNDKDFETRLKQLSKALNGADDLIRYVNKFSSRPEFSNRVPCGIIGKSTNDYDTITVLPYIICKPRYMLLSEETAKSFDLLDLKVGNLIVSGVNSDPLPLETYDIKYYANEENPEKMLALQQWDIPTINPGGKLTFLVKNNKPEMKAFRGVMWCDTLESY